MGSRSRLLILVSVVLLAVGGAVLASNMAFKFVPTIATADPDIYEISLPYNTNLATLKDVFDDISASAGCTAASVTIFNPDQSSCVWLGDGSCNVGLDASYRGHGVRVSVGPGGCAAWSIVGSADPTVSFSFAAALVDPSIYQISIPYHTTALTTQDLFDDLCAQGVTPASIKRFSPNQSTVDCLSVGGCANSFGCTEPVNPGEGFWISVANPGSWTPKHY